MNYTDVGNNGQRKREWVIDETLCCKGGKAVHFIKTEFCAVQSGFSRV